MSKTDQTKDATINYSTFIVEGSIVEARTGRTRFSDEVKNRVAIKSDSIPYDEIVAYVSSGSRMTPAWFKDKSGFINASSMYDIPVMNTRGVRISFEDWISNYNVIGAEVRMSFTQKDGAIYPKAIKVLKDGEEIDPFTDL